MSVFWNEFMEYNLSENLAGRKGVISNLHGFLNRHLDTGFKSKWSGYWTPPHKYLDYFSFKVNGIWLDSKTLEGVEYGDKFIFYHETGSLSIEEHVSTPEEMPGLKVKLKIKNKGQERKAVQTVLEPGIDIRHKSDDLPERSFELEEDDNRLNVSALDKKLVIESDRNFKRKGDPYTKEHYPGEKQKCFIPGEIVFREEIPPESSVTTTTKFLTSEAKFSKLEDQEQELRDRKLGRTFKYSIESMKNLIYDREGLGLIAGHPWFQEYWARDTFWTVLGLIDAGYFELSKKILENFAEKDIPGLIQLDTGEGDSTERADTLPLFVIAVEKLKKHYKVCEELEEAVDKAFSNLELEDGVVQHGDKATWMDTLERSPAVDIQGLWLAAAEKTGKKDKAEKLREGLEKFQENGYLKDYLGENAPKTINPAVPLMFGLFDEEPSEEILEKINGEFSSMYGARTRSVIDPGYKADGYHEGAAWGLTTMWAAAANLQYGKERQGINHLEKMTQFVDRNQPGALPEVVNAETGDLMGCSEQAWSAGLFVHVVDSYILGIQVKDEKVVVDPVESFSGKRIGKRVGDEKIDLKFEDGEVEVLNSPSIDVVVGE
ncbi:MAG: amylo-alpha-1,6-glucosidase [Candidatus Nanohalobium sp.]